VNSVGDGVKLLARVIPLPVPHVPGQGHTFATDYNICLPCFSRSNPVH
jgi:hypothetical protein